MWSPNTARVDEATVETYLKSAYQSQRAILCESKQSDSKESSADGTQGNDSAPASGLKRKIETPQHETGGQDQPKLICLRDDETALKLLYESQYDVESALVAWKRTVSERVQKEPAADDPDRPWTEEEQTLFEDGLKVHGKNFRLIQQEVRIEMDLPCLKMQFGCLPFSFYPIERRRIWFDITTYGNVQSDTTSSFKTFDLRSGSTPFIPRLRKYYLFGSRRGGWVRSEFSRVVVRVASQFPWSFSGISCYIFSVANFRYTISEIIWIISSIIWQSLVRHPQWHRRPQRSSNQKINSIIIFCPRAIITVTYHCCRQIVRVLAITFS